MRIQNLLESAFLFKGRVKRGLEKLQYSFPTDQRILFMIKCERDYLEGLSLKDLARRFARL